MTNAAPPSKSINDEIEQTLHGDALIKKKLTETINQMNSSSESASKDELNGLLNNFIGASGMPDPGSFENLLPMIEGKMQSLLSKDLLYCKRIKGVEDLLWPRMLCNRNGEISHLQTEIGFV